MFLLCCCFFLCSVTDGVGVGVVGDEHADAPADEVCPFGHTVATPLTQYDPLGHVKHVD
jgi:hypothetical protein